MREFGVPLVLGAHLRPPSRERERETEKEREITIDRIYRVARDSPYIIKRKIVAPIRLEFRDIFRPAFNRPRRRAVCTSFRVSRLDGEKPWGSLRARARARAGPTRNFEKHALDSRVITCAPAGISTR